MATAWDLYGPPLRPSVLDVETYQAAVDAFAARRPLKEALILGVTPELCGLNWPEGTHLRALDRSPEMIETVWPGNTEMVIRGEWSTSGLPTAGIDLVFCDGGLHLLNYPTGQAALVAELTRIIAPGGEAVFRLFLPPLVTEAPDDFVSALKRGEIADMNTLKLRLAHALTRTSEEGVALTAIWHFLHQRVPDHAAFFQRLGWSSGQAATFDFYRDSQAIYHFAPLERVLALFGTDRGMPFRVIDLTSPDQPMGEQCVHLRLERT